MSIELPKTVLSRILTQSRRQRLSDYLYSVSPALRRTLHLSCFLLVSLLAGMAQAQNAYQLDASTPIIFSDNTNILVYEDSSGTATVEDVMARLDQFKPASQFTHTKSDVRYWVTQKLASRLTEDRVLRLDAGKVNGNTGLNWFFQEFYIVDAQGNVQNLRRFGNERDYLAMEGLNLEDGADLSAMGIKKAFSLRDINPYADSRDDELSQFPIFNLRKGEEVRIFSRLKSTSSFPAKSFSIGIYDHMTMLEMRRHGLYLEGILLGILVVLALVCWHSVYHTRDKTSIIYGLWLIAAILSCGFMPIHDGQRFTEFLFGAIRTKSFGVTYVASSLSYLFAYTQIILYVLFARYFLNLRKYFPRFYQLTNFWIGMQVLHFIFLVFIEHQMPPALFWLPAMGFQYMVMLGIGACAISRYRQGLDTAKYFILAFSFYIIFYTIYILGVLNIYSIASLLPTHGSFLFFKNDLVSQALALCSDAIIMQMALAARMRWLQQSLARSIEEQKELVEGQNKVLELTVAQRTAELASQHKELEATHELVMSSVNYASRLQRGQLPRPLRLQNRFNSIATIWEPRDTIGGDSWWVSSSQHDGPYVLALADCTGHGVPGAMLSLLVSNSLERIYANDTSVDPSVALISLDHYVRTGLNQDRPDSESDDGCDAAVLRINRTKKTIEFAGAKIGLFHVRSDVTVTRYAASRTSLGYQDAIPEADKPVVQTIQYQNGELFALVTDGITDQIGVRLGTKISYGYRRLESVLLEYHLEEADIVVARLKDDFLQWQGTEIRRDDLTAVIFKL